MTFEEAFRNAARMYFKNSEEFDELESSKNRKYNKKYFDSMETEFLSPEEISKKKVEKTK